MYMNSQIQDTKDFILNTVPQVTSNLMSKSKRALLPFVGDIASGLFGLATHNDVRKLANHINAFFFLINFRSFYSKALLYDYPMQPRRDT